MHIVVDIQECLETIKGLESTFKQLKRKVFKPRERCNYQHTGKSQPSLKFNPTKSIPRHIITNLSKVKAKGKTLKVAPDK